MFEKTRNPGADNSYFGLSGNRQSKEMARRVGGFILFGEFNHVWCQHVDMLSCVAKLS